MLRKGFNSQMIRYQCELFYIFIGLIFELQLNRYFCKILDAVSSGAFYQKYVRLPAANDPIPEFIHTSSKFWPYFGGAIGAMDGTHINCCPSAEDRHSACNRKGGISQNCLACCSFSMKFVYFLSGWEGSAADATMYARSCLVDLTIPAGKFYLADAGFGICDSLLVPYRGVHYHLAEWGRANLRCQVLLTFRSSFYSQFYRPANREELFNL